MSLQANERIKIIAAGGVNSTNADDILSYGWVNGIHAGSSVTTFINSYISTENSSIDDKINHESKVNIGLNTNENLDMWPIVDVKLVQELVETVMNSVQNKNDTSWRDTSDSDQSTTSTPDQKFYSESLPFELSRNLIPPFQDGNNDNEVNSASVVNFLDEELNRLTVLKHEVSDQEDNEAD